MRKRRQEGKTEEERRREVGREGEEIGILITKFIVSYVQLLRDIKENKERQRMSVGQNKGEGDA